MKTAYQINLQGYRPSVRTAPQLYKPKAACSQLGRRGFASFNISLRKLRDLLPTGIFAAAVGVFTQPKSYDMEVTVRGGGIQSRVGRANNAHIQLIGALYMQMILRVCLTLVISSPGKIIT